MVLKDPVRSIIVVNKNKKKINICFNEVDDEKVTEEIKRLNRKLVKNLILLSKLLRTTLIFLQII